MRNIKEITVAALTLAVICAVVVAALAGTNALTKDVIAAQEQEATAAACREVIDADSFMEDVVADGDIYYEAYKDGAIVGYVFKTVTTGKSSGLTLMTGVSLDGTVTGVKVVSDSETAGYIGKVEKGGLFERLTGCAVSDDISAVDGVSQATKSSNGVKAGVSTALRHFAEVNHSE